LRASWLTTPRWGRPGLPLNRLLRPSGSIYWRLWFGVALVVGLVGGAAVVASVAVRVQNQAAQSVVQTYDSLENLNLAARADFAQAQVLLRAYLFTGTSDYLTRYSTARRSLAAVLARARGQAPAGVRAGFRAQQRTAATWFAIAARELALARRPAAANGLAQLSRAGANAFYAANHRLQVRLQASSKTALARGRSALDTATVWSRAISALAVALVLAASVNVVRGITRPLTSVSAAVRKLAAGEHAVRADEAGYLEVHDVARAVNVLADEGDRLRHEQAETSRLLGMARETGNRIRARLRVDEVVREASAGVAAALKAEFVRVLLVEDGTILPPVGYEREPLSGSYVGSTPPDTARILAQMYRRGENVAIADLRGPEADWISPKIRVPLVEAGVVSHMLVPFGVGEEFLGFVTVERLRRRAWTPTEVRAVELVASDIGRAVRAARLYEDEERLVAELREVDKAKSDFLAAVSHELRTPLTGIVGYLELLRAGRGGTLSTTQAAMLDALGASAFRLRGLIEDVLTTSRIEAGAFKTVMAPVDLADLASAAAEALRPEAEAKQVSLAVRRTEGGLIISGDATQLDHALMNLVSNAVKFTPTGGKVVVAAAAGPGSMPAALTVPAGSPPGPATRPTAAVVTIRDTGIGIPDADKPHLFDRFFRASNAVETAVPGTGIGLAIVRSIVTNHGGTIDFDSLAGEGTTVTLRLPMPAAGHPPADRQPPRVPGPSPGTLPARDGPASQEASGSQ
jgi:signal transduction histidine kinase/CHASE3 domain sensor protein